MPLIDLQYNKLGVVAVLATCAGFIAYFIVLEFMLGGEVMIAIVSLIVHLPFQMAFYVGHTCTGLPKEGEVSFHGLWYIIFLMAIAVLVFGAYIIGEKNDFRRNIGGMMSILSSIVHVLLLPIGLILAGHDKATASTENEKDSGLVDKSPRNTS